MNLPSRRTKIVATLGPASSDSTTIENLIKAGVNVFRFNFSHGTHEAHEARYKLVREASKKLGKHIAILQDLQGPKLRVGNFPNGSIVLEKSEEIILRLEDTADQTNTKNLKLVPYNYELLASEVRVGHRIFMDDGNIEIVVTGIKDNDITAQVVFGGVLKDHKGMNFPDTKISIGSFTPKDREDLLLGMKLGVDYVALSFVREAEDIREVQKFMHTHKVNIPVVAKIEKGEAIANLLDILNVTDAVMVARGDLAVEVGTAQVPSLQKQIIAQARLRGIPVITATQMLESMISTPRPTRAEASDVANAVLDGSDAVMLSAESASGKFPVLTVSVMHNIILETELRAHNSGFVQPEPKIYVSHTPNPSIVEAIEHAAASLAAWINAKVIACTTHTGHAAMALAKFRPPVRILAFTDLDEVANKLALVWGVETIKIERKEDLDQLFEYAEDKLVELGLVERSDIVVLTAGWPPLKHGTTSLLKVVVIRKENPNKKVSGQSSGSSASGSAALDKQVQGYRTRKAQFVLDQSLCIQCGGCVEVCPNDIFGIQDRKVYLKESNCKNCTFDDACMEICPTNAIEIMKLSD